jgi:ribosomal protein S18 acetylase RimI-like enzyme
LSLSEIRLLEPGDTAAVLAFFDRIPEGDQTFFKEPVDGAATVAAWLADDRSRRLIGLDDTGEVIGYVAVIPGVGWSGHVAELRLVVDPKRRGQGLGRRLASAGLEAAVEAGLTKVVVEVVAEQVSTIALFQQLGFVAEALLEDHVRDASGRLTDLIVLSNRAADTWATLETVGLDAPLD